MRKLLIALFILFVMVLPSYVFAAAGSCTQALNFVSSTGNPVNDFRVLTFNCTFGTAGDAGTALTSIVSNNFMDQIKGMYLLIGTTYNGSTAPTALYDIVLKETVLTTADAVDILGGAGNDRPGTTGVSSQFTPVTDTSKFTSKPRPVLNTLKLTVSGNAVASGNTIIQYIFVK